MVEKRKKEKTEKKKRNKRQRSPIPLERRRKRRMRPNKRPPKSKKSVDPGKIVPLKSTSTTIDEFSNKLQLLKSDLSSLSFRVKNIPSPVSNLDNNIDKLSHRVSGIRNGKYFSLNYLENDVESLKARWDERAQNIFDYGNEQEERLLSRISDAERGLGYSTSLSDLNRAETQLKEVRAILSQTENSMRTRIQEFSGDFNNINNELKIAEETLELLINTSIGWKKGEYPVLSVRAHEMIDDQRGVLTLTTFRVLFEEIKEVVLKRSLFIATEKKTVHEVIIDQPIGSIDSIEKGKVGFFQGGGLYLNFKSQVDVEDKKFDTRGDDDERFIRFYQFVVTGEAEKELSSLTEEKDEKEEIAHCPHCSAPFTEEILLGQTSIRCKYCGTIIKL
jgi:DNA-directed RNA polymerase subunit RPC12/RpoP